MKLNLSGVPKEAILDQEKVNNGIWLHLESSELDEATGQTYPLYLGGNEAHPQRALVRYYRCRAVKEAETEQQKNAMVKMRVAPRREKEKVVVENSLLSEDHRFSLVLVALENVGAEPGIQYLDPEDAKALYKMDAYDSWVQQIRDCSQEEAKYAATSDTEAGNGSQPASSSTKTTATTETKVPEGALQD